jgi:formylglycine-generating enzyme required for sulfatase activity
MATIADDGSPALTHAIAPMHTADATHAAHAMARRRRGMVDNHTHGTNRSMASRRAALLLGAAGALVPSCAREAPKNAQLLVVLDTDAVVVGQLAEHERFSPSSAIDSIRIDLLDSAGRVVEYRELVATDTHDWPISFGIAGDGIARDVRLRVRAFRGAFAHPTAIGAVTALVPEPALSIDRVVDLPLPTEGTLTARILLSFACFGVRPSFLSPARTCVDAARLHVAPDTGVEWIDGDVPPSAVGTTDLAREIPCTSTPPEGAICIPGGFTILGDPTRTSYADLGELLPYPARAVRLSPFFIDRTEFTVGHARALFRAGLGPDPRPAVTSDYCTFEADGSKDTFPLNCVGIETARAACAAVGGELPSEAQWEYVARGRGRLHTYPWGEASPACCTASVARIEKGCDGRGAEPVASHLPREECVMGDVSRDEIVDLGGSLGELTADKAHSYEGPCWNFEGVALDPICVDDSVSAHVVRGGTWASGRALAASAYRFLYDASPVHGFRCVYRDGAP